MTILEIVITEGTVLRLAPQVKFQSLGAGQPTVIVSLLSGYLYTANQTTLSFLQALDGEKSFGSLVAELLSKYEVSAEKLTADLKTLSEKLVAEQLLTVVSEASTHA